MKISLLVKTIDKNQRFGDILIGEESRLTDEGNNLVSLSRSIRKKRRSNDPNFGYYASASIALGIINRDGKRISADNKTYELTKEKS